MRRDLCADGGRIERAPRERTTSIPQATHGRAALAGNYDTGMMILALAMGHTVERPVMGMGGGTIIPMERLPAAV